jgi:hypothetical protein
MAIMMRFLLCATAAFLMGGTGCMAQVSTMGTTAMGIPSTPGAIVSSPLNGPSPFSATTQPGAPVTTLAPVPLALDPTTPGTSINCSSPAVQITTTPPAPLAVGSPSTTGVIKPSTSTAPGTISSSIGTIAPASPLGNPVIPTGCTSTPGNPTLSATALPLSTPTIASSASSLGAIQPDIAALGDTSIDPAAVVPTPNSAACSESVTMTLANPGMMAPANATGAVATPGVSPPGC